MGKLKLAEGKRARPIPISLKPKHLLMLSELEKYMTQIFTIFQLTLQVWEFTLKTLMMFS